MLKTSLFPKADPAVFDAADLADVALADTFVVPAVVYSQCLQATPEGFLRDESLAECQVAADSVEGRHLPPKILLLLSQPDCIEKVKAEPKKKLSLIQGTDHFFLFFNFFKKSDFC